MPATKSTTPRKAAKKATARPRAVAGPVSGPIVVPADEVPAELRGFYGPPQLGRARGAGTTGPDTDDELSFDTSTPVADMPMERLFSIDGVDYFIPIEFPPAYSLVYLDNLEQGRDVAVGKAMKLAIGMKGWTAMVDLAERRPDLITPGHMRLLMNKVLQKIMGTLEDNGEGNG